MKKVLCLVLALLLLFSTAAVLVACDTDHPTPDGDHTHVDANKDGKCDICGKDMKGGGKDNTDNPNGPKEDSPYTWDTTTLRYQMTKNSNDQGMPSGCERYMAGEDATATENLDDMITTRNQAAYKYCNVEVIYDYYPDASGYGWGASIETIYNTVLSNDPNRPDLYSVFITDMVCTSLKGSFANLMSTSRGTGDLRGENYFQFLDKDYDEEVNNLGYMYEYSKTLTLSKFKMYVLGSDYFTDLVRAFSIMPVNVKLLNSVVEEVDGDYNNDGVCNIDDFYDMVKAGKWNYEKLADYCDKIYQAGQGSTGSTMLSDELVGLAVAGSVGQGTSFIYTSSVIVVHREWSEKRDDYDYYYAETNPDLERFCANLKTLFESRGVVLCENKQVEEYGATAGIAIRERFTQNHVLFGGTISVGTLEYDSYQNMKDGISASEEDLASGNYGFGIAPMPLYRSYADEHYSDDKYLTLIGTIGKGGAISATTTKFAQCTAFLDYQSTHSTDILNEYYDYKLQYDVAGGTPGNVYILQYIRTNVRSSFDKVFEDAIGIYFRSSDADAFRSRWTNLLDTYQFKMTNIAEKYAELYPTKAQYLASLVAEYDKLPD